MNLLDKFTGQTTANNLNSGQTINQVVSNMTETDIINEFIARAKTTTAAEKSEIVAFFNNPNNKKSIVLTYEKYGFFPYNTGWRDVLNPYYYALYRNGYPPLEMNAAKSCDKLKDAKIALEMEKANVLALGLAKTYPTTQRDARLRAIADISSEYESAFTNLSCSTYEETTTKLEDAEIQRQTAQFATELANTTSTTAKYFIFGVAGLIVLLGVRMLIRRGKKH